jgi:hypothetical protein
MIPPQKKMLLLVSKQMLVSRNKLLVSRIIKLNNILKCVSENFHPDE